MLHSFSAKNFYSLGDEVTVDFVVNEHAPQSSAYFRTPSGIRLSKLETVIGSNASGKTNILKAISFIQWLLTNSFKLDQDDEIEILPFLCASKKTRNSEFGVKFELETGIYNYLVKLNRKRIVSEVLELTSPSEKLITTKTLFKRTWDTSSKSYKLEADNFKLPKNTDSSSLLRQNTSLISSATHFSHRESIAITNYWKKMQTNVTAGGYFGYFNQLKAVGAAIDFYFKNKRHLDAAVIWMSRFDLDIKNILITPVDKKGSGNTYEVEVEHKSENLKFDLSMESSGTLQMFTVLSDILIAIESGGFVVLDELDSNLHPLVVQEIIESFLDPALNPKNAQLLVSTHNTMILSKLDKYQITLTEKGENGSTEAWRLDEMTGVRSDDNYFTKYMAGAYGAIPKV